MNLQEDNTAVPPTDGPRHVTCGTTTSPASGSQEETRIVNRSLPKRKAPLVKDESLSTSLMTSPTNSPRAIGVASEALTLSAEEKDS